MKLKKLFCSFPLALLLVSSMTAYAGGKVRFVVDAAGKEKPIKLTW